LEAPFTSQNPLEFERLLEIYIEKKPKNVLEIGTHEGGTLYYWLNFANPGSHVIAIDDQHVNAEKYNSWRAPGVKSEYFKGKSQSLDALDYVAERFETIDWLFIDGGHHFEEVHADYANYGIYVKSGGIIIFHDILSYPPYSSEVDLFWGRLKRQWPNVDEIVAPQNDGFRLGPGLGVIYV